MIVRLYLQSIKKRSIARHQKDPRRSLSLLFAKMLIKQSAPARTLLHGKTINFYQHSSALAKLLVKRPNILDFHPCYFGNAVCFGWNELTKAQTQTRGLVQYF